MPDLFMNQNNNLNNSNNSSNNNDNDNVILIKEEIKQYLIKKGYDPNPQVKNLPKNQSIYANDYEKANYFPPDLITDGGIRPNKTKFMPSIIAKRGFFPKWDYKAKAKWPGFVNSLLM